MTKYIIATHGNLAEGFKSSLKVLMGKDISDKIITINGFTEDKNPKETIKNFIATADDNDKLIIFTDWFNGSINQSCITQMSKNGVYVITGINLPIICEVITSAEVSGIDIDEDFLRNVISNARNELIYVNDKYETRDDVNLTDESNFF